LIELLRTFLFPSALGKGHFSHTQSSVRCSALTNGHIKVTVYGNGIVEIYEVSFSEILGFRTLSIVLVIKKQSKKVKNTTFRKPDLFPSSGEGKPTLLGPLERASLSHRTSFK
jgi:hypothetical protein